MKTKLLPAVCVGACALAWAAKDPVIMTVNGDDVPKSEFEYLYHKNSQQQMQAQPIDEYVGMFINYRLKVADAKANGIDTTATFRQEMAQYRHDLAAPYLADSLYLNQLVDEAYQRSLDEVNTSHIMLFKRPGEDAKEMVLLDSLKSVIDAGGDFAALAAQYSEDRGTNMRGGRLGYITQGRYPYNFEKAAYALPPGEVSGIVESPIGYHLIKSEGHRPARGSVRASHILLLDKQDATPEEVAAQKERIDSIYNVVKAQPSKFEELAIQLSDDKGSARQGGLLPWFTTGQMVPEFEEVAFATPVGEISAPFRSKFGWHIINKIDQKGPASKEEMKAGELNRISNPQDERYLMVKLHQNEVLGKKHKAKLNEDVLANMRSSIAVSGLDSIFYATYEAPAYDAVAVITIGKQPVSTSEFVKSLRNAIQAQPASARIFFDRNLEGFMNRKLVEAEENWLEANNTEYRNLYHEYCNGSLLYEASVKNVWDKASKDKEGLEAYFESHRGDYGWQEPRAKGVLVQAKNDSVAADIVKRYAELNKKEALSVLRKEYKGEAEFKSVLMKKGENPMVDNLMFGAGEVKPSNANYTIYFMLDGRLLTQPEESADVRGAVTGDYQEALDKAWIEELHAKYPVVVNQKVLKQVK